MNLSEIIRQSIESLLRNRLRSGLTMLGIIWGLVTVVLLLSYGKSLGEGDSHAVFQRASTLPFMRTRAGGKYNCKLDMIAAQSTWTTHTHMYRSVGR